jgi:hypothetical protein
LILAAYLVLAVVLVLQGNSLIHTAKKLASEKNSWGSAQFAQDFTQFDHHLKSFSATATNPFIQPIFFVMGTPGTFSTARDISHQISQIFNNLTPEIVAAKSTPSSQADSVSPGAINLDHLAQLAPALAKSQLQIQALLNDLSDLHLRGILSPFDSHLQNIRTTASQASVVTSEIDPLLPVAASMLGINQSKSYLVAFQNLAEARGTGGIIGAYAIITASRGNITINHVGSDTEFISADSLPISMPLDFQRLYGQDPAIWQNSNLSPHFPNAARIWLALWKKQSGQSLDGVIALDPYLLKQFLVVNGPILVDGQKISATNVISQTLSLNYIRYASDNTARKQFLVNILKATLNQITKQHLSARDLLEILQTPLKENRIDLYSNHVDEQKLIETTSFAHLLPSKPDNSYRLIINNTAGNKMDVYLTKAISITSLKCGKKPVTQVDFTVVNTVDPKAKLPAYVKGRLDLGKPQGQGNSTSVEALLFGPSNSTILGAMDLATKKSPGLQTDENSHPVLVTSLELKPGAPVHIRAQFSGGVGKLAYISQPMVNPDVIKIDDRCSR